MNLLPDELTLEVLSRLPQSSLLAYSQTCQKNLAFVRGSFIKTVPPRFLAERLFPQGLVEPLYTAATRCVARPSLILEFAPYLHPISPLDAIALFKKAYSDARTNKSYDDLIKCADLIAPLYPEIAAALYQEAHEIQPTYATALLGMAKTCPKQALAIHTYAIPLIARTEEKHYLIGRHLPAIIEHILS